MFRYSKILLFFFFSFLLFFSSIFCLKKFALASSLKWELSGLDGKFINAVVKAPSSDCVLYVSGPNFVYRTNNCGDTWEFRGYGLPQNDDINSLAVDFSNPDVVFAGAYWNGLYKTTDGGLTWLSSGLNDGQRNIRTVSIGNQNGWVYVGTGSVHRSLGGVLVSKNGGLTWAFIGPSFDSIVMKVAIYEAGNDVIWLAGGQKTWKSINGGADWEDTGFGEVGAPSLVFDSVKSGVVYAGRWIDGMYKTVDGAISWLKIDTGMGSRNIHNLIIDPTDNKTLYLSTRSAGSILGNGVYVTHDMGSSWETINSGLPDLNIFPIGLNAGARRILFAGVPNRGIWRLIFPQEQDLPLVFLPGLGGGWCRDKILFNKPCDKWVMNPINHGYDNFFESLKGAGLVENKDFYKFPYDWTQGIDQTAGQLRDFINSTVLLDKPPGTKVKLVGHCMGGLVIRGYLQKYYGDQKAERLVLVDTPNKGTPQFYGAWEGGEIWVKDPLESFMANLLLKVTSIGYLTSAEAIRDKMPSALQMLPTFDFLEKTVHKVDPPIPVDSMKVRNLWLKDLGQRIDGEQSSLKSYLRLLAGNNHDTLEWIEVVDRSWLEKALGLWEDGRPINKYPTSEGDGTVLKKSVDLGGVPLNMIDQSHGDSFKTSGGLKEVFNLLDVNVSPKLGFLVDFKSGTLFLIASPARLRITNKDGQSVGYGVSVPGFQADILDDNQGVFIPGEKQGFKAEVVGQGTGSYRLFVLSVIEDKVSLDEYFGETKSGKVDTYNFEYNSLLDELLLSAETGAVRYLSMAQKRLDRMISSISDSNSDPRRRPVINDSFTPTANSILKAEGYLSSSNYKRTADELERAAQLLYGGEEKFVRANSREFKKEEYLSLRSEIEKIGWYLNQAYIIVKQKSGASPDLLSSKMKIGEAKGSLMGLEMLIKASSDTTRSEVAAMIYKSSQEKISNAEKLLETSPDRVGLTPVEAVYLVKVGMALLSF